MPAKNLQIIRNPRKAIFGERKIYANIITVKIILFSPFLKYYRESTTVTNKFNESSLFQQFRSK